MKSKTESGGSTGFGKFVFAVAFVAMIVFFWWLLIYDHGVVSVH